MPRAKKRRSTSNLSNAKSESKMPKLSDEDNPRANEYDFTTAKSYTDLVLRVDGRELHVNRSLLMMASPVFQKMFESNFCEKSKNCIDLPEKNFDDVHLLLQLLVPCSNKKITYDVALQVYPLADEYQIDEIKKICVDVLIKAAGSFKLSREQFAEWYIFAARYGLESLQIAMTNHLTELDTDALDEVANTDIHTTVPWNVCQLLLKALARDREKLRQHEEVRGVVMKLFKEHSEHCKSRHMTCCRPKCEPVSIWAHPNRSMPAQCWQQIVYTLMQSQAFNNWFEIFSDSFSKSPNEQQML